MTVRSRILTDFERRLLETFLSEGIKQSGFKMLLHRMRKDVKRLQDDMELIMKVLKSLEVS